MLCYYCCFRVTPDAVQAPLKQFSQCTSPSPLFTPVRLPGARPVGEPAGVLQVCKRKTVALAPALPPCPCHPPFPPALCQLMPVVALARWQSCSAGVGIEEINSLVFSYSQVLLEGGTYNREGGINSKPYLNLGTCLWPVAAWPGRSFELPGHKMVPQSCHPAVGVAAAAELLHCSSSALQTQQGALAWPRGAGHSCDR